MINLIIENRLEDRLYAKIGVYIEPGKKFDKHIRRIKPYDEEKWKNGKIYEFNTLKEVSKFIGTCDIHFSDEYANSEFYSSSWEEIDIDYIIDETEDNLIRLFIDSHWEWTD